MNHDQYVWGDAPDFRKEEVMQDPIPHYHRMLERGTPFYDPVDQVWYVFSWSGVRRVLRNKSSSVNRFTGYLDRMPPEKQVILRPFFTNLGRWMTFIDDAEHRRLRTPVQRAFDSKILVQWEEWLEQCCGELVERAIQKNTFDCMTAIAEPLPLLLICEMLGIPDEDRGTIKDHYASIVAFFDRSTDPEIAKKALQSESILRSYMEQRLKHARSSSVATLMTLLARLQEEQVDLSDADIAANAILIVGAGHETTTSLLGTALWYIFQNPEWISRVAIDSSFRDGIIEEALRLQPPLQRTSRIAREEIEVDGVLIPAGARICLLFGAANRDPSVFPNPDKVDPTRPSQHHSFSGGVHYCVGAKVARMEASILLRTFCVKAEGFRLKHSNIRWLSNMTFRTMEELQFVRKDL
jgi:cytochrome P450